MKTRAYAHIDIYQDTMSNISAEIQKVYSRLVSLLYDILYTLLRLLITNNYLFHTYMYSMHHTYHFVLPV